MEDTRLLEAASEGKTDLVLQLLEEHGQGLHHFKDKNGQSPLHLAAAAGHMDTVTALTLNGADVNAQDFSGRTALQRSASEGQLEVSKHLVARGASIDHQDEVYGNTALMEAAWRGFSQTVEFLCRSKSNYYLRNKGGFSPLHLCCQNGHNETCRVLLRAGCKPNIKNNYGDTPLATAARYGHAGVARILISAGCNPDLQNKNLDTPLHIAAAMGRRKLTKIILEAGPDLSVKNQQKETSMDIAKRKSHSEIVAMIENPPPIQPRDQVLSKLAANGGIEIVDGVEVMEALHEGKKHRSKRSGKGNKKSKAHHQHRHHHHQDMPGNPGWSPYGCHYYPDPDEFPEPNPSSLPDEPLAKGEQYYLDLAGNIKKGPASNGYTCFCAPFIQHVEKKMDRNKKEMFRHLDLTHGSLANRINHLEKRTRDQLSNLSNSMKETFAQERLECQDRMERRAIRDRVHQEQHRAMRDAILRGDLANFLEKRIAELEANSALRNSEDAAFMRTILRSSRKRKKSLWSEMQSGTLRRAASEDNIPAIDVPEDQGSANDVTTALANSGLRVSDEPKFGRVRRNSAGEHDLNAYCDFGDFNTRELPGVTPSSQAYLQHRHPELFCYSTNSESQSYHDHHSDRASSAAAAVTSTSANINPNFTAIYQNFSGLHIQKPIPTSPAFPQQPVRPSPPPMLPPKQVVPPPYRPPPFEDRPPGSSYFLPPSSLHQTVIYGPHSQSDGGNSHDSHNDSGYCTRPGGGSGGPSPSLSGSQGRPDSRGPMGSRPEVSRGTHPPTFPNGPAFGPPLSAPASGISQRIRQLQTRLALGTNAEKPNPASVSSPKGSLV